MGTTVRIRSIILSFFWQNGDCRLSSLPVLTFSCTLIFVSDAPVYSQVLEVPAYFFFQRDYLIGIVRLSFFCVQLPAGEAGVLTKDDCNIPATTSSIGMFCYIL